MSEVNASSPARNPIETHPVTGSDIAADFDTAQQQTTGVQKITLPPIVYFNGKKLTATKAKSTGNFPEDGATAEKTSLFSFSIYVDNEGNPYIVNQLPSDPIYEGFAKIEGDEPPIKSKFIKVVNLTTGNELQSPNVMGAAPPAQGFIANWTGWKNLTDLASPLAPLVAVATSYTRLKDINQEDAPSDIELPLIARIGHVTDKLVQPVVKFGQDMIGQTLNDPVYVAKAALQDIHEAAAAQERGLANPCLRIICTPDMEKEQEAVSAAYAAGERDTWDSKIGDGSPYERTRGLTPENASAALLTIPLAKGGSKLTSFMAREAEVALNAVSRASILNEPNGMMPALATGPALANARVLSIAPASSASPVLKDALTIVPTATSVQKLENLLRQPMQRAFEANGQNVSFSQPPLQAPNGTRFIDKDTADFVLGKHVKKFDGTIRSRLKQKLTTLTNAKDLKELEIPGNNLEKLGGGGFSIRVNQGWRICFDWVDGKAVNIWASNHYGN